MASVVVVNVAYHNDCSCNMTCLLIDYESHDYKLVHGVASRV